MRPLRLNTLIIESSAQLRCSITNNYFFNVFPDEVRACLVAYCDFDTALNSLMQQELSTAWHVLAMIHPNRNVPLNKLDLDSQ